MKNSVRRARGRVETQMHHHHPTRDNAVALILGHEPVAYYFSSVTGTNSYPNSRMPSTVCRR